MNTRRALLTLPPLLLLASCGFKLREPPKFEFKTIRLAMPDSAVKQQINRQLTATGQVRVVGDPAQAEVTLVSPGEKRDRVVLSFNASGEVTEYQLLLRFSFHITGPGGRDLAPETEIVRRINQSYSDTAALSKGAEAEMLYQNMQNDVVQQVMRQLAMVKPGASAPSE